jgi:hypothetical protein
VYAAKCFLCLRRFFTTFDVRNLVVREIKANNGHGLLDASLVVLQQFGIRVGMWSIFGFVSNVPNINESQKHLYFDFPKIKYLLIKLVHESSIDLMKHGILLLNAIFAISNIQRGSMNRGRTSPSF